MLSSKQRVYVERRVAGLSPIDAAQAAGYGSPRVDCWKLERSKKIIEACAVSLMRAQPQTEALVTTKPANSLEAALVSKLPAVVAVPVAASSWVPPKIPLVEPVTRAELVAGLSSMFRDADKSDPHRLLAAKILNDLHGWEDKSPGTPTVINLGAVEEKL